MYKNLSTNNEENVQNSDLFWGLDLVPHLIERNPQRIELTKYTSYLELFPSKHKGTVQRDRRGNIIDYQLIGLPFSNGHQGMTFFQSLLSTSVNRYLRYQAQISNCFILFIIIILVGTGTYHPLG